MFDWDGWENRLSDACDDYFGETFEFRPQIRRTVNERGSPDPGRPVKTVTGIWHDPTLPMPELSRRRGGNAFQSGPETTLTNPVIRIDVREFDDSPRQWDQMLRNKTGELYEIASIEPDGQGRLVLEVNRVKR